MHLYNDKAIEKTEELTNLILFPENDIPGQPDAVPGTTFPTGSSDGDVRRVHLWYRPHCRPSGRLDRETPSQMPCTGTEIDLYC